MNRPSSFSRSFQHRHPVAAAAELPLGLFLALIYLIFTAFFVVEWAGVTAAFNELAPASFEAGSP
jgi:hypothetical protein